MPRQVYIIMFIAFSGQLLFSQRSGIDSLVKVARMQKEDTNRIITWIRIAEKYNLSGRIDSSNNYVDRAYRLAEKLKNIRYRVAALRQKVTNLSDNGKVKDAEAVASRILAISDSAGYLPGKAAFYATMAGVYTFQSQFRQAEEYYLKAVELYTKLGLKSKITSLYNALGWVCSGSGDYKKAVNYLLMALESAHSDTNTRLIGMVNLNLGEVYAELKEYDKALELNEESYRYYIKSGDVRGQALALGSSGSIYSNRHEIRRALRYLNEALLLCDKTGYYTGWVSFLLNKNELFLTTYRSIRDGATPNADSLLDLLYIPQKPCRINLLKDSIIRNFVVADSLNNIAKNSGTANALNAAKALFELTNGNYSKSIELFQSCIGISEKTKNNHQLLSQYLGISEAYQKSNDFPKAYAYLRKYLQLNDSVSNDEKKKSVLKDQAEFEFKEKEFQLRSEKEKQKLLIDIEQRKQKTQRIYFVVILVLFAGGLSAVAIGYRRKSKDNSTILQQKEEIEKQKNIVDDRNKEVLDSITYAKRLQKAILPPLAFVKTHLPESFVFYKPKDIVAGDFYWMEVVESSELSDERVEILRQNNKQQTTNNDLILIAAADCTGHGVPGAMVSIVCSNALDRSVKEFGLRDPGMILDKTREMVLETFAKSEEKVNDGMDISLCSLRYEADETVTVCWAGANNALVYITKNGAIREIKANKQPIGMAERPVPFLTHTLQLQRGDSLYLFTDGFPDQFGGPKGRKYKRKPFVTLLSRVSRKDIAVREQLINDELASWQGTNEQIDDILVIGFKL